MDEDYIESVLEAFVRLHEMGLIYRKKRLVNWDPVLKTAVSDLEVRAEEEPATLYFIRYRFADKNVRNSRGEDHMTIATTPTRNNTCRRRGGSQSWGRKIHRCGRADGACTRHRQNHSGNNRRLCQAGVLVQVASRSLPPMTTTTMRWGKDTLWKPSISSPKRPSSMKTPRPAIGAWTVMRAREKVLPDFRDQNLLAKEQKHSHSPPRGDRSGVILEPYLTEQWFIKNG